MQKGVGRIALGAVLVTLLSCGDGFVFPVGVPPRGVLTTDSLGYTARVIGQFHGHNRYSFRVITRYENTTALPAIMLRCDAGNKSPMYSVTRTDGDPTSAAYNPGWACTSGNPLIVVAPGEVRIDTLVLQGPSSFDDNNNYEPTRPATQGRFRLSYGVGWNCPPEGACPTPDSLSLSNEFVVRVER